MLFTEEVVKGIKKLIRNRSKMGISEENNLVFACGQNFGSLGGWDVLQGITKKLPLKKPKLITPTRTRKMVSTLMQLLDLTDGELTWITNHMGHTKDVQLAWYRKHDSTLELTKVARALMCVDQGNRHDLQNKKIGELDIRKLCYFLIQYRSPWPPVTQAAPGPTMFDNWWVMILQF